MRLPIALLSVCLLSACATPQENPIYQYSSNYDPSAGLATQSADYRVPPASLRAPAQTPAPTSVYTRVETDCIDSGGCSPTGVAALTGPTIAAPWESPTDTLFADGASTPGFQAIEGTLSDEESVATAEVTPQTSPPVSLGPSPDAGVDKTLTISGPIFNANSLSGTQSRALMYRVEPGDTAYSISKSYCTSPDAIQSLNGLDADFRLSAGQDIKVPSLCQ